VYRVKYLRNIIDGIAYGVFQGCSLLDPIQHVLKNGHEILAVPETGLRHGVEVPMEDVEIWNAKKRYGVRAFRNMRNDEIISPDVFPIEKDIKEIHQRFRDLIKAIEMIRQNDIIYLKMLS
jgi:hypothetical protein